MIILAVILIVLGYTIAPPVLATIGWVVLLIGLVFWILGGVGHPVAGRRYWF